MSQTKFFPHINALRCLAIAITVIGHLAMTSGLSQHPIEIGRYGVDLFFTISGFLITLNLLDSKQRQTISLNKRIKYFFINRSLRIFPAYYCLLIALFIFHQIFRFVVWDDGTAIYYFTYTSNFLFYNNGFSHLSYLNHTWSLAVEEQFYILWPFIILLFSGKKIKYIICFFIIVGLATQYFLFIQTTGNYQGSVRLLPFANYHTIGSGALIAYLVSNNQNVILKIRLLLNPLLWIPVLILITWYDMGSTGRFSNMFHELLLCTTTMSLVYRGWKGFTGATKSFFDRSSVQYIGKISYGIYLFESPVSFLILGILGRYQIDVPGEALIKIILLLGCTLLTAHFSYKYIEQYFLKFKKKYH
jgi:peptidoglycan/LPS O-acetylase OafA/YrhL